MQNSLHPIYSFEDFTLDLRRGCLLHGSSEIKLRNKSLKVLTYLVENRGRLIGKDELIGAVWPDSFVSDESVTQCLTEVQRALSDDSQRYVKTVPRRGYIFDVEVKESKEENSLKAEPIEIESGKEEPPKLDEIDVDTNTQELKRPPVAAPRKRPLRFQETSMAQPALKGASPDFGTCFWEPHW